jgi:hypothetical protein
MRRYHVSTSERWIRKAAKSKTSGGVVLNDSCSDIDAVVLDIAAAKPETFEDVLIERNALREEVFALRAVRAQAVAVLNSFTPDAST